tara:strand:- start:189 stop:1100 length:912 start_codon:yes stop_codon:yes gene_type:complete
MSAIAGDAAVFQQQLAAAEAAKPQNQLVLQTIRELSTAFVYPERTNVETNRKLWDEYAKSWDSGRKDGWSNTMANQVGSDGTDLQHVGDEWSDAASLHQVLEEFLYPYLNTNDIVAEIGTGGGRIASKAVSKCESFTCMDVSMEMLKKAKGILDQLKSTCATPVKYVHLKGDGPASIPIKFNETYDFIYSFDVFVHLDLHTIWGYLQTIHRMLKTNGKVFLSTSNVLAPLGWDRFSKQSKYTVGGFYFVSPDMVKKMSKEAGFKVIQESQWDQKTKNVYYERDYLFVLEKLNKGDDEEITDGK